MQFTSIITNCSCWSDFAQALSQISSIDKGYLFERIVQHYLKIDATYSSLLKHVWRLSEIPSAVAEKLNLPAKDIGIDLICESHEGSYWAVQAKYRTDESKSLTWSELSTFSGLAFGVCRNIEFGLVCTTADRLPKTLEGLPNIGFCSGEVWRALDAKFFKAVRFSLKGDRVAPKAFEPRDHQMRAVLNALQHFGTDGATRGKMIWPCGTGKSLAAYWIAEHLDAQSIIVAVPSLALIRQTLQMWLHQATASNRFIRWLCVCSDESVGKIARDDLAVLTHDLGIPCTTNAEAIRDWLAHDRDVTTVVFVTYQSGEALCKAAEGIRFDLGIFDEAHKTAGAQGKPFARMLFDDNIVIDRRMFMTATERRYAGRWASIISMDNSEVYGNTFDMMSFKEAIASEPPILSDYRILFLIVSKSEIEQLVRAKTPIAPDAMTLKNNIDANVLASLIALRKTMANGKVKRAITFHSSIKRARQFAESNDALTDTGHFDDRVRSFHVSGIMPTSARDRVLREFEAAELGLVTNARCLTEGVDIPVVDNILFADPKKSVIDIVQASGRALRLSPNKKMGYIIVPVVTDSSGEPDSLQDDSAFESVIRVLRALAANDERIVEYFREAALEGKESGGPVEIIGTDVSAQGVSLSEFSSAINTTCWRSVARFSWRSFAEAREFARSLRLTRYKDWLLYCNGKLPCLPPLPADIPKYPYNVYKHSGWKGVRDWLGFAWRSFEEARKFAQGLKLGRVSDWKDYCDGKMNCLPPLPADVPKSPWVIYEEDGWTGMVDWLGANWKKYKDARRFVRSLGLRGIDDWKDYCSGKLDDLPPLPADIPKTPWVIYEGQGWTGVRDWLGQKWSEFLKAKQFAQSLGLRNYEEWLDYVAGNRPDLVSLPSDVPKAPNSVYRRQGWRGWGDWLRGRSLVNRPTASEMPRRKRRRKADYLPFADARQYSRRLGLRSVLEWRSFCRGAMPEIGHLPSNIPSSPESTYRNDGWIGFPDWLGYLSDEELEQRTIGHRPFTDAREFAVSLGLKRQREWIDYCDGNRPELPALPTDIPRNPHSQYKQKGWKGYPHWLGYRGTRGKWRSFKEARQFVQELRLAGFRQWLSYCKGNVPHLPPKPDDIPASPATVYSNAGWKGWQDWLGYKYRGGRNWRSFASAREFARGLGLRSYAEWKAYCRGELVSLPPKPPDIPLSADCAYRQSGWVSWPDWLGTDPGKPARVRRKKNEDT